MASEVSYRPTKASAGSGEGSAEVAKAKRSRGSGAFRVVDMQLGVVSQAAGSALVSVGDTKVLCAVYGPRAHKRASVGFSDKGTLVCDFKYAPFSTGERREKGQSDDERQMSLALHQCLQVAVRLESFPKSALEVHVLVLEADGGELPAAVVAASLALANARVEMNDLVAACSVGAVGDELVVDPTRQECLGASASTTVALMPSLGELSYTAHTGQMAVDRVAESVSLGMDGCASLYRIMRETVIAAAKASGKRD